MENMQRLLTRVEQAQFLARHPIVAAQVTATKAVMVAGLYDPNYYDLAGTWAWQIRFPGVIEPIGTQVEDSAFGLVTIQPAADMEIYFSGWTDTDLGTDRPYYNSPPGGSVLDDFRGIMTAGLVIAVVGVAVSAYQKRG